MFNPHHHHQQQQQQFHQHLRQLQQLFQQQPPPPPPPPPQPPQPPPSHHIPHHHQSGRPIAVAAPAPPPPRMVNLCSATQATIIAPNPMLQGALLMQQMQAGNMRGFAMGGQQFPQFFPAGSRSSLLGPVPMGVAIKTPHMGFAPRPYNPHARYMNNDFTSRQPDRKRESEQRPVGTSEGQPSGSRDEAAVPQADGPSEASAQQVEEPAQKKPRIEGPEEATETNQTLGEECKSPAGNSSPTDCIKLDEGGSTARPDVDEALEQSRAAEIQSVASPLKADEQENGESQILAADPEELAEAKGVSSSAARSQEEGKEGTLGGGAGGEASNKFYCYICNITCHNQQNFQSHMNGLAHQQRMMEIQHMSNACLVTLLPKVQESLQGSRRDGEKRPGLQRWCSTCQTHFTSNVLEHRRTREHKLCSRASSPCCTVCKQQFRTSREFVEHMQTPEHQQRVQELRESQAEGLEDLSTLDEKGCFVGEEEAEERDDDMEDESNGQGAPEITLEDMADDEAFDPDTIYGASFLVPVAGFLCRLCNRFYQFESTARHLHCKSLQHFENLKKYRASRNQEDEAEVEADPDSSEPDEALLSDGDQEDNPTNAPEPEPIPQSDPPQASTPPSPHPHLSTTTTLTPARHPEPQEEEEDANQGTVVISSSSSSGSSSPIPSTQAPEAQEQGGAGAGEGENAATETSQAEGEEEGEEEDLVVVPTTGRGRGRGAGRRRSGRTARKR